MSKIVSGDNVRYTGEFCRSIGAFTGEIPFARGRAVAVTATPRVGFELARVEWSDGHRSTVRTGVLEVIK